MLSGGLESWEEVAEGTVLYTMKCKALLQYQLWYVDFYWKGNQAIRLLTFDTASLGVYTQANDLLVTKA